MIKFIWINFNYVVCKKPLFLYFGPWCVSWDKQYAVAQDNADFKELIVPCWEVGAPERECRHSDGEQRKTKHSPLAVSKAVTMATSGVASDESPALGTAQKTSQRGKLPDSHVQYIPRNTHTAPAPPCSAVVIHWLIFPYPSGLLHWHCGNLTIAPVPAKQPWWIWINTSFEFIMNDCITTTKQSTTKPRAYFLGYTVSLELPGSPEWLLCVGRLTSYNNRNPGVPWASHSLCQDHRTPSTGLLPIDPWGPCNLHVNTPV